MGLDNRRDMEFEKYKALKNKKEGSFQPDGSITYYVIDANWVN